MLVLNPDISVLANTSRYHLSNPVCNASRGKSALYHTCTYLKRKFNESPLKYLHTRY